MHRSRLIQLLQRLSPKEMDQLGQYVQAYSAGESTYHKRFYAALRPHYPQFTAPVLEKQLFLASWPKEEEWTVKQLSYQMSAFSELIEQFLIRQTLLSNEWEQARILYDIGRQRELPFLERKGQKRIEKWLDRYPYRDSLYYHRRLLWEIQQHRSAQVDVRSPQPNLQATSDALDHYYALEKTRHLWEMINMEAMVQHRYDMGLGMALQNWLAEEPDRFEQAPILEIYRLSLLLLTDYEQTDSYFKLKTLLQQHEALLTTSDLQDLYTSLLNFCTRRLNQFADENFRREYFQLNQELLRKGWLLQNGQVSVWRYINLVASGLRLGEADWVGDFIEAYRPHLPKELQHNIYHYSLGQFYYYQEQLDEAQRNLALVSFEEPTFNIGVRLLLAQIYYDADEIDLLFNQLEANRLFLIRDSTISDQRKEQMHQFQLFLRRLARLLPNDKDGRQSLREELPAAKQILYRQWLLDRL